MSDVASDAYREILSRVPAESLPNLRRVCKAWQHIIDDPSFFEQVYGGERLIIHDTGTGSGKLYSLHLSSLNHSDSVPKFVQAENVKNLSSTGATRILKLPVPSCHGLILLCDYYEIAKTWTIWNPFLKEFVVLPPYDHLTRRMMLPSGGIGYDAASDDYKVVRVSGFSINPVLETLIYSLKWNTWHRIEDYPNCILMNNVILLHKFQDGVYFKGALYWFVFIKQQGGDELERVLALDLGTEKYHELPVPPASLDASGYTYELDKHLDVSGGCLFVSFVHGQRRFDMWMLNDQGREKIWEKFVSLELHTVGVYFSNPRLISYSKSKHQVVIRNGNGLLWFDMENKCGRKVYVQTVDGKFSCQAFALCLVRLNRIGHAAHANEAAAFRGELKRKRSSPSDRLVLKVKSTSFQIPSQAEE